MSNLFQDLKFFHKSPKNPADEKLNISQTYSGIEIFEYLRYYRMY